MSHNVTLSYHSSQIQNALTCQNNLFGLITRTPPLSPPSYHLPILLKLYKEHEVRAFIRIRKETHRVKSSTMKSGWKPDSSITLRSVEVQVASTKAPAARPAFSPDIASSITRPGRMSVFSGSSQALSSTFRDVDLRLLRAH